MAAGSVGNKRAVLGKILDEHSSLSVLVTRKLGESRICTVGVK
jgi:hypothetical protein